MKVLLFFTFLIGLTVVAQGNLLTDAHASAMIWHEIAEGDIEYYRDYLTVEVEDLSNLILEKAIDKLETASNPALGAAIQECVEAAFRHSYQLMSNVDDQMQILQKEVNELHQIVLDEILDTNLMATNFDDFPETFRIRLSGAVTYIDFVLINNVVDYLLDIIYGYYNVSDDLDSCFSAAIKSE